MKIFLTGATGYIGGYVVKMLLEDGHQVHALCRKPEELEIAHENLQKFEGDITDKNSIRKAMTDCEQVYHLAAFAKPWTKDPGIYYKLNFDAVKTILDLAVELKISKMVFTSTAGVLGPSANRPVKESDTRIGEVCTEYEDSKTMAEDLCRKYAVEHNLAIVIVNPPRIYGPGPENESNSITKLLRMYDEGKWKFIPGNGKKIGNYVHVEDVAKGHLLAMEHGKSGERYILGGENLTYEEFFGLIKKTTGKQYALYHIPVWVMMLAGHAMVLWEKMTGKAPLLTPKWIKKYNFNWALDVSKAKSDLGYQYRSFEQGITETYHSIKSK